MLQNPSIFSTQKILKLQFGRNMLAIFNAKETKKEKLDIFTHFFKNKQLKLCKETKKRDKNKIVTLYM